MNPEIKVGSVFKFNSPKRGSGVVLAIDTATDWVSYLYLSSSPRTIYVVGSYFVHDNYSHHITPFELALYDITLP